MLKTKDAQLEAALEQATTGWREMDELASRRLSLIRLAVAEANRGYFGGTAPLPSVRDEELAAVFGAGWRELFRVRR